LSSAAATGALTQNKQYAFDALGNRTDLGPVNNLNQYTSFSYDARGNLLDDGTYTYGYDPLDRLISVTPKVPMSGSKKLEMGYDSQGRRIWKKVFGYGNGSWTLSQTLKFAYDGWNLVAEFQSDGAGNDVLLRSYAWGQDASGGGIGALLSITDYSTATPMTYLPFYDGNGNVTGLTDAASGSVVATYDYDPFGNLLASSGPAAGINPFRFSTKYFDAESGLYYFGYRYYSPSQGRFLSRDPSGEFNGGANLYAFVGNDPVDKVDALGLNSISNDLIDAIVETYMETGRTIPGQPPLATVLDNYRRRHPGVFERWESNAPATQIPSSPAPSPYTGVAMSAPRYSVAQLPYAQSRDTYEQRAWANYKAGNVERFKFYMRLADGDQELIKAGGFAAYYLPRLEESVQNMAYAWASLGEPQASNTPLVRSPYANIGRIVPAVGADWSSLPLDPASAQDYAKLAREIVVRNKEGIPAGALMQLDEGAMTPPGAGQNEAMILRPVEIQFPARGLSPVEQQAFAAHLAEQEMTLNRLSLTATDDLRMNLLNYRNIKPQVAASRQLARSFLPGTGASLDAAHALDAVAGGYTYEFAAFRSPVQQRIGALWRTRTAQIVPGREHRLVPVFLP
jgi:RHS repeat-associated protein